MKKIIIISCFTIFSILSGFAQGQYEAGMAKGFELWSAGKSNEAIAMFERISQAEQNNWIPTYYAANVLITQSFSPGELSERFAYLESAKEHIAECHKRSPQNSEIYTLEGMLYTGYVAADPGTYGMTHSQKIMELHAKAIELDPKNPRAHANSIEYEMGSARFFGQDLSPFCKRLEKVLPMFEEQNGAEAFAPSYGKERVEQVLAECGK